MVDLGIIIEIKAILIFDSIAKAYKENHTNYLYLLGIIL